MPWETLTPKTIEPVSVWVSKWTRPTGADMGGAGADVGLGDAVIAAEDDRGRTGVDDLADRPLDCLVARDRVGGQDRRVAVVDDPQLLDGVDPGLEVGARRAAGGADRARAEARAGPIGDEVVGGSADDRASTPSSSAGSSV